MKDVISREVAERILLLKRPREDWGDFAKRLGLKASLISNYRTGANGAGVPAVASVLARVRGLSGHWLLTNEGPMWLPVGTEGVRLHVIGKITENKLGEAVLEMLPILRQTLPEALADELEDALRHLGGGEGESNQGGSG